MVNDPLKKHRVNLRDVLAPSPEPVDASPASPAPNVGPSSRIPSKGSHGPATAGAWERRKSQVREEAIRRNKQLFDDLVQHESDVERLYRAIISELQDVSQTEKERLFRDIVDDTFGWGVVEALMRDNHVTEILIDAPDKIWYTRDGLDHLFTDDYPGTNGHPVAFESDGALMNWLQNLIKSGERALTYESPMLDDDLPGGARLQATIPPVSEHPTVNIRKSVAQTQHYTMDDWVQMNILSAEESQWICTATAGYANVMIIGPTGSGKTTLIRILIEAGVSPKDRIILIEDIRETNAKHPRFLSLRVVKRKKMSISATDIFEAAMRKTPKRVFVSELRAPEETVAFLQTIASGHPGAITSQHGEEPDAVLNMMVARAVQGGWGAIAEIAEDMVFALVHVLVFVRPITDEMRRVTRVVEVVPKGLWPTYGKFRDIFRWDAATDTHQWINDPLDEHLRQWEFANRVTLPRCPHPTPSRGL